MPSSIDVDSLIRLLIITATIWIVWNFLIQSKHGNNNNNNNKEGYIDIQAPFPRIKQASFIPSDSATATTARPELAKPEMRDYVDAHDSFQYLLDAYSPQAVQSAGVKSRDVAEMIKQAILGIDKIKQYVIRPESVPSRDILKQAADSRQLADKLRRAGEFHAGDGMFDSVPGTTDPNYYCSDNLRAM